MIETDLRRRAVWLTETGALRLEAVIPIWRVAHSKLAALMKTELACRLAQETEVLSIDER